MNIFFAVLAALMLVFIVFQGRSIVPRVVAFLLPGKRKLYFEENYQSRLAQASQEEVQEVIKKFETLGFTRLGVMVEKAPLASLNTREISLASEANKSFASLGFRRRKLSYYIYTPFTGGQVAITGFNAFRDFKKNDFVTTVDASGEPAETLEMHKKQVEEFIGMGYTPYTEFSREAAISATNQYYNSPYPRQQLRIAGFLNLGFMVICILLFLLLLRSAIGG